MRFVSTAGSPDETTLEAAVLNGLAPDGGLYWPVQIPRLEPVVLNRLSQLSLVDLAHAVATPFAPEIPPGDLRELLADALDFPVPLVALEDDVFVLELFHGPTLAFKDVGARFMARLMGWYRRRTTRSLTVLVATSGDTGSAVAQAFFGVEGIRVVVLYPQGKVSRLQESQFTTLGGNVAALAVSGDFDDCQRMVKEAFADETLREEQGLTSANSINIGRLLPQMFYYFHAVSQLADDASAVVFSTPSGNFGNLTAGLMARAMGLPCAGFVAATNVNDAVPRYLENGRFVPHPSHRTLSTAMDVGNPSNFERMLALFEHDVEAMRLVVSGSRHDDQQTREAIGDVDRRLGVVLDPHTAVGYLGLRARMGSFGGARKGIVLATAHPAKFREDVEPILGREIALPERLARCLQRDSQAVAVAPDVSELSSFLRSW